MKQKIVFSGVILLIFCLEGVLFVQANVQGIINKLDLTATPEEGFLTQETDLSSSQQDNTDWVNWFNSVSDYLEKMQAIGVRSQMLMMQMQSEIYEAKQEPDKKQISKAYSQVAVELDRMLKELKAMQPPSELEVYHEKYIESVQYIKLLADALAGGNKDSAVLNFRKSILSLLECLNVTKISIQSMMRLENLLRR